MPFKRFCFIAAAALLINGCANTSPGLGSKNISYGDTKYIEVGAMRVARENGFLTVKAQLTNTSSRNRMMYYRFAWLGNDGFPVADEESWKSMTLYGSQSTVLPAIAPVPRATDFRIEINTP